MRWWSEKLKESKWLLLFFTAGLALGVALFWLLKWENQEEAGMLSDYFLRQFQYIEINQEKLFSYILSKRLKWYLLLWILGFSATGYISICIWGVWCGFSSGVLLSLLIVRFHMSGVLFWMASLLPHTAVYLLSWLLLFSAISQRRRMWKRKNQRYVLTGLVGLLLLTGGIFLESSISPWIMRQVFRYLMT